MSINLGQFSTPRMPIDTEDKVVGYQIVSGVPTLAQYTMLQLAGAIGSLPPSGPAGGDLSGTYPNPVVSAVHATGGTLDGVVIGGTTPAAGAFTTVTASTPIGVPSGGTGLASLPLANVLIGNGTSSLSVAAPGAAGRMLISTGPATSPAFSNAPTIIGGSINATPIGAVTPNSGSFLAVTATGTITPSQTNGIVGTTTNNNANAGSVGEYLTATNTGTALLTGVNTTVGILGLTAGDWDVTGSISFIPTAGASYTQFAGGLSLTAATLPAVNTGGFFISNIPANTSLGVTVLSTPVARFSLAAPASVFVVAETVFTGGTMSANAFTRARRVR